MFFKNKMIKSKLFTQEQKEMIYPCYLQHISYNMQVKLIDQQRSIAVRQTPSGAGFNINYEYYGGGNLYLYDSNYKPSNAVNFKELLKIGNEFYK